MEKEQFELLVKQVGEQAADKIKSLVQDATKGMVSREDLTKAIEGLGIKSIDDIKIEGKSIAEILKAQGEEIEKAKSITTASDDNVPSVRMQIKAWQEANKDALEKIKAGQKAHLEPLSVKVPTTMTVTGGTLNSSAYLPNPVGLPGLVDLVRVRPTFWRRLRKGRVKANPLYWVNKTNKEGNAQFIGEGVLKPLASFELETETSVPKKVAERMKVSTELLYDLDAMETYIMEELRFEVETAANAAVLTGTLSSTSPAGITTIASAYSLTTIKTDNPTTADAVRAASAQIRSLNFDGTITAYMNPIDIANMDIEKATDSGVYMLPPFASADNTVIKGVEIIEDNNIPVGFLLIGDMDKYRIMIHQDFHTAWGWEDDDFSKNLVTVIGEMRFHQFYSSNHVGAWIYDEIADIKAAITTV